MMNWLLSSVFALVIPTLASAAEPGALTCIENRQVLMAQKSTGDVGRSGLKGEVLSAPIPSSITFEVRGIKAKIEYMSRKFEASRVAENIYAEPQANSVVFWTLVPAKSDVPAYVFRSSTFFMEHAGPYSSSIAFKCKP